MKRGHCRKEELERRPWRKNRWREEKHGGAEVTEMAASNKAESKHRRREKGKTEMIQAYWDVHPGHFVPLFGELMKPPSWLCATESAFPACSSALMVARMCETLAQRQCWQFWSGESYLLVCAQRKSTSCQIMSSNNLLNGHDHLHIKMFYTEKKYFQKI